MSHSQVGPQSVGLDQSDTNPTAEWTARELTEAFPLK
jgi:hypothetical protein